MQSSMEFRQCLHVPVDPVPPYIHLMDKDEMFDDMFSLIPFLPLLPTFEASLIAERKFIINVTAISFLAAEQTNSFSLYSSFCLSLSLKVI